MACFFSIFIPLFIAFLSPVRVFAGPVSPHYELTNYGFGAGGTESAQSTNFKMMGIAGEQGGTQSASANNKAGPGLVYTMMANLPATPTFTNPGETYDRLKFVIDNGGNPTDATFAIAISDDDWSTTKYIQDDLTIGSTLGTEDWLIYDDWGGATGSYVTGLFADTTYNIKVKARRGNFTESGWSADDDATTSVPSLTFGVSSDTITFDTLGPGNSWTDSDEFTKLTTSTNAYNGYTVYGHETDKLKNVYGDPIDDYGAPNSAPTTWTGTGFGYTTTDDDLGGGGDPDRFTSGGPKYAGYNTSAPGDPVADHTTKVEGAPITGEEFTITYRVTASESHAAGRYTNSLIYVVVPVY